MRTQKPLAPLSALAAAALALSLALTGCSSQEQAAPEAAQEEAAEEETETTQADQATEEEPVEEESQVEPVWVVAKETYYNGATNGDDSSEYTETIVNELDEHGNVTAVKDADGNVTTEYAFDEFGNRISTTYPRDGEDDATYTSTNEVDEQGRLIRCEDSGGLTIDYTYDEDGRVASIEQTSIAYRVNEDGSREEGSEFTVKVRIEYDENGFRTKQEREYSDNGSRAVSTYSYELGENGLPVSGSVLTEYSEGDGDGSTDESLLVFEYDEHGNVTHIERNSASSSTVYDYEYTEIADPSVFARLISSYHDF